MNGVKRNIQRTTRRLIVRPLQASDYPMWLRTHTAELHEPVRGEAPEFSMKDLIPEKFKAKLAFHRKGREQDLIYAFGIFFRSTGEYVGGVDLAPLVRLHLQSVNLGYEIHPQFRRQGFAQEAARAALDIAFRDLHFNRVEACMETDNKASRKVAEGIGMRKECTRKRFYCKDGKWVDNHCFVANPEDLGMKPGLPKIRKSMKDYLR